MTREHTKLANKWIHLLGLQDWNITIDDNCSPRVLFDSTNQAENYFNFTYKIAKIKIVSDKDNLNDINPMSFEHLLVHELLHCKFSALDDSGNFIQDKLIHQLIEDFTKILVSRGQYDT